MKSTQFRLTLRAPNDCTETAGHTHCAATLVSKAGSKATFSVYCTMCGKVHTVTRRAPDNNVTRPVRGSWKTETPASLQPGKLVRVTNEGVDTGFKIWLPTSITTAFTLGNVTLTPIYAKVKLGPKDKTPKIRGVIDVYLTDVLQAVDGKIPASWLIDISDVTDESEPAEAGQELAFA